MKRFLLLAVLFSSLSIMAQEVVLQPKELIKERKEMAKMTQKAVDAKVTKAAKKEAKALSKEGWKPSPGALPIVNQLDDVFRKRVEMKGSAPRYIIGSSTNSGNTLTSAKKAAMEFARQSVAEQISAEFAELINTKVGNSETGTFDAESITQLVNEGKTLVQQKIGQLQIIQELFREQNGKVQVSIVVAYESRLAREALLKALENTGEETRQQLDEMTSDWGK